MRGYWVGGWKVGPIVRAALCACCASRIGGPRAAAHFYIFEYERAGAIPPAPEQGMGWIGQFFFIPDGNASSLLTAESYIIGRPPDFTFRTPYIDFPAGPLSHDQDSNFATIGDFLDDYIYDVSDPAPLEAPFNHFLLRFTGLAAVKLEYSTWDEVGLPPRIDFGTWAFDGFRTRMGSTSIYRVINTASVGGPTPGWYSCDGLPLTLGLFPVTITYFNRYDPAGATGNRTAGLELYSWYPGGLPWPAGETQINARLGPMTIVPPEVIYQPQQVVAPLNGDFEADFDLDLVDFRWLQVCFTGADNFDLGLGCFSHDFDYDGDLDGNDYTAFAGRFAQPGVGGPGGDPLRYNDRDGDHDSDFKDLADFQACFTDADAALGPITPECAFYLDVDQDLDIDLDDFGEFLPLVTGPRGRLFGGEDIRDGE